MSSIPKTMRALAIAKYCKPTEYDIATLPTPAPSKADEILIKVHSASINPIDVKMASGFGKLVLGNVPFPYQMGFDLSGVVVALAPGVSKFKVGDEVYARLGNNYRGSIAEYALAAIQNVEKKPSSLTFSQAAAIPLAGMTALQCLDLGEKELSGGLKGKTIYIPGGLSGTGHFGVQLAKNVFGAEKVITTLSPGKISKVKSLLGNGTPDQIIDYTKENVKTAIGKGTVDYMFDPVAGTLASLPMMKNDGVIVSVSTLPSGSLMKSNYPNIVGWLVPFLNLADWFFRTWASWKGVRYSYLFLRSDIGDLNRLTEYVEEGKLVPVIGRQVKMEDVEGMRKGCQEILDGKGGVGKFVIDVV